MEKVIIYPADAEGYPTYEANSGIDVTLSTYEGNYSLEPLDQEKLRTCTAKLSATEHIWEYTERPKLKSRKTPTELERKQAQVRAKRANLLTATDFFEMRDYVISDEELKIVDTYRQALRDVTEQESFAITGDVEWPKQPEYITKRLK